ncbi:MAG TPA: ABC transporter permease, partial [Kribbella sp.]
MFPAEPAAAEVEMLDAPAIEGRSPFLLALRRLRSDRVAMISLLVIVLIVLMAIFAPLIAAITGHPPNAQYRDIGLTPDGLPKPPSGTFWLGTDDLGRDVLVRIAYGARISLLVGVAAT